MSPTEPSPTEPLDAVDSDAAPAPGRRRGLVAAAVAVLGIAAAGATGFALARGSSDGEVSFAAATSSPTTSSDEQGPAKDRRRGPGGMGGPGRLFGGGALHGQFVVPDGSGGYRTVLTQHGTASKVSASSVTVRSEDGFTTTYTITADTRVGATRDGVTGIADGADVVVLAEQKGGKATALHLADLAAWGRPDGRSLGSAG